MRDPQLKTDPFVNLTLSSGACDVQREPHQIFEDRAAESPEAVACISIGISLSYAELNARANRLAHYFLGIGLREVVIACRLQKSNDLLVAILAIHKAGCSYLPLDPREPAQRALGMLEEVSTRFILTDADFPDLPPTITAIQPKNLQHALESQPSTNIEPADRNPDRPAYFIFTSGTTGKPKCIAVPVGALVNLLVSMQEITNVDSSLRLLSVTAISFDPSILEFYLPLILGGAVVIASNRQARDGKQVAALLYTHNVNFMQATPAGWRMLIDAGWKGTKEFKALTGGDVLAPSLANELVRRCDAVWNVYGPTETTIWAAYFKVSESDGPVPIGKPIANTRFYVVDANMRQVPIGSVGELCIAGKGISMGYVNQPELTSTQFIQEPGNEPALMYRTGDQVREGPEGLEFLGRIDHQVKVRGYRIELSEVERTLEKHPGVNQAVAIAAGNPPDVELMVFVTGANLDPSRAAGLRSYIAAQLPAYMVPARIIVTAAIPVTQNGKIDRKRLLETMPCGRADALGPCIRPSDEFEQMLVPIWKEVLGIEDVGVTDNFFDLGGHSMLALKLLDAVERSAGVRIPVVELFKGSTIRHISHVLSSGSSDVSAEMVIPISRGNHCLRPTFFAVAEPGATAIGYLNLARHLDSDQPLSLLRGRGFPGDYLYTTEQHRETASRYIEAMRKVQPEGPYCLGGFCQGAIIAFEMVRQLEANDVEVALLINLNTWPRENTRIRALTRSRTYSRRWASLRGAPLSKKGAAIHIAIKNRIRWILHGKNTYESTLEEVYWPKSFVPTLVRCPILVIRTGQQLPIYPSHEQLSWSTRTTANVRVRYMDGHPLAIFRSPQVEQLAEHIVGACREVALEFQNS